MHIDFFFKLYRKKRVMQHTKIIYLIYQLFSSFIKKSQNNFYFYVKLIISKKE
jgi:hypothetical protein